VNELVSACHKEWKRLGVPNTVAEEMVTELETHLREAHADGISTVHALGPAALDPCSFAQEWAEARGVIPPANEPDSARRRQRRLPLRGLSIPFTAFGLAVVVGALMATQRPTWRHFLGLPHLRFMGSVTGQGSFWAGPSVELIKVGTLLLLLGIIGLIATSAFRLWTHAHRAATG
jgi:hypothetical protein